MFRFHTGSIKSVTSPTYAVAKPSFDSILVRLKGEFQDHGLLLFFCFDSILVRLKVGLASQISDGLAQVSIPYWFD